MKLLLTSGGITNKTIEDKLRQMCAANFSDLNICFVPTAANIIDDEKNWLIEDLKKLQELNFKEIDIVDISSIPKDLFLPRLTKAEVIFFEGGSNFHLMREITRSGLYPNIKDLLKEKVFVGVSAGSMVCSPNLLLEDSQIIYEEDLEEFENLKGLGFVDFYILPHLNSKHFKKANKEYILENIKNKDRHIYVLDDESALSVEHNSVQVISEGEWFEIK